jgi:hypothetical protein
LPRQCWVDQPNQPDYIKLGKYLITDPIFDGRWLVNLPKPLEYLKDVKAKIGGNPGAYFCAQGADSLGPWPSHSVLSGSDWADWAYDLLQRKIAPGTSGAFPVAHLNAETDDIDWQMAMLKRWRSHAPRRLTVWSPVAHKATLFRNVGWKIAALGIIVAPQCYVGPNNDRVDSANEVQAWVDIGIPAKNVWPFLFGTQLGAWWGEVSGAVIFTQGQLQ